MQNKEERLAKALIKAYCCRISQQPDPKQDTSNSSAIWISLPNVFGNIPFLNWHNVLFYLDGWSPLVHFLKEHEVSANIIDYSSLDELEVQLSLMGFLIE